MAVQTFTLPEVSCPAGQQTVSPSTVISNHPQSVLVQLTSSEWAAKAGQGTIRWGVQNSPDGAVFTDWIFQPLDIGTVGKNGGMPTLKASGGEMLNHVGYRVRLFADVAGVGIALGAQITVTS